MPFTPAHVAAVLPLRGRAGLPFAALAAGSMSPDVPYFLPFGGAIPRHVTHSVSGIFTWDLMLGLAMWLVWRWLTPSLHDMAPRPLRDRWHPPTGTDPAWLAVVVAVVIGAATHVLWDALTHHGWLSSNIGFLHATYPSPRGGMAGYRYLQYASGGIGVAIVVWAGFRQPATATSRPRRQPGTAAIAPVFILTGAMLALAVRVSTMHDPSDRRALVFVAVTSSISGAVVGLILVCVLHTLVERSRARRPAQP